MPSQSVLVIDDSPTILKVVQMVLTKAGYEVRTATDGEQGIQSAREQRPDVILLDFVMPRMNGYQVCRILSDTPELSSVPVVLMSAKGDQVGERFVRVMGIVDYITKPFSPEAISAVVSHTIAKYGGKDVLVPVADPGSGRTPAPGVPTTPTTSQERRKQQIERIRSMLRKTLTQSDELAGADIAERVDRAIGDGALVRLLDRIAPEPDPDTVGAVLQGDLGAVPIAEVLTLLAQQMQTGILALKRESARILVCFRDGKVQFAGFEGPGEEFLLGRYVLDLGAMPRSDFDAFLAARVSGGELPVAQGAQPVDDAPMRLLGEQLVQYGHLQPSDLHEALRLQTCERIYESLRWRGGSFAFSATTLLGPLAEGAALNLSIDGILMEGFRRVDEWHLIERVIDDFDAVFLRNEAAVAELEKARLTRDELSVLELVNGKNTVKEIQRQSRMGSFDVSKMLFRLLSIKLIRRRVTPVAV